MLNLCILVSFNDKPLWTRIRLGSTSALKTGLPYLGSHRHRFLEETYTGSLVLWFCCGCQLQTLKPHPGWTQMTDVMSVLPHLHT
jgi:hypothetical protein